MTDTSSHYFSDSKLLWASLTKQTTKVLPLTKELYSQFIGGRGLGVKLVFDHVTPTIAPLSPENLLIFAIGPLTATSAPTAGRFVVVTKSPLTGTIFDSHCGGYFGPQLRRAGFAALILEGKASSPLYLWISDEDIEFRSAKDIWGKEVSDATDSLLEETDSKAQVACIGPAGEKQVNLASIMTDKHRAAGRGGVGAVMGSKNVKAIVVQGTKKVAVANPEQVDEVVNRLRRLIKKDSITNKSLPVYGTPVLVNLTNELGMLPTHNFQEGTFNDAEGVSGEKLLERLFVRRYHCFGCPIGCGRITKAYGEEGGGPEYETLWALGPQCGINDLEWIAAANYRCNQLGLDTISLGSTLGCAMELVQKGKLDASLHFGETEGLLGLIEDTGYARGLGVEIGKGSKSLATRYHAPDLAMHVKGLELPAYDPRGVQGHALSYATSNRGGCHLRAYLIGPEILGSPVLVDRDRIEGKAELVILFQNLSAAMDSLVLCRFTTFAFSVDDYAELVTAATNLLMASKDFLQVGERIWTLERLFNIREGFSIKDDQLPPRFSSPLPEGGSRNRIVHLDKMLPRYYKLRGWDSQGQPSAARVKQLNLG
ncbi:MAG: aldehyde ferredoxin oxidoreductase family protein [Candidatus Thorarchaeota archaeon]